MSRLQDMFEGDDLAYTVTVNDDEGDPKDITGATVEAAARPRSGTAVEGSAVIANAAVGTISVSYAEDALTAGEVGRFQEWTLQVRVTISGETQTVSSLPIKVHASAF